MCVSVYMFLEKKLVENGKYGGIFNGYGILDAYGKANKKTRNSVAKAIRDISETNPFSTFF